MSGQPGSIERLPETLRAAIGGEFSPVTPLLPPWRRALNVTFPALAVVTVALWAFWGPGPRLTTGLGSFGRGGVSVLEWAAGFALLWLAMREAVPGLGYGARRAALAVGAGVGVQLALGLWVWQRSGASLSGPSAVLEGALCATMESAIAMPHFAAAVWLVLRGLPVRPGWSGALAGAAAGLIADGVWHLACARSDLQHLLVWHFGATLLMTALGAVSGSWWRRRVRSR